MKRVFLAIVFLFTINYSLLTTPVYAQVKKNISLSVNPSVLEIQAKAPSNPEAKITIQNKSEKDINLDISIKPFRQELNGQVQFLSSDEADKVLLDLRDRIKLYDGDTAVSAVKLAALESKDLTLKINVDKDLYPQDYYFTILFTSNMPGEPTDSTVSTQGGIGTNVILSITGNGSLAGHIEDFSSPFFLTTGPVNFKLLFQNDSIYYEIPRGSISVTDLFGKPQGRIDILPQYVLSGASRYLIDNKKLGAQTNTLIWPQKFLFGIYKANLTLKLSEKGPIYKRSIVFIGLPLLFVSLFAVIGFILGGIVIKTLKMIKRK